MIKVVRNPGTKQIKANIVKQEGEIVNILSSIIPLATNTILITFTPIFLKGNNHGLIVLAHNPVFHTHIKYKDI